MSLLSDVAIWSLRLAGTGLEVSETALRTAQTTLEKLIENGNVIPVINENDSVAVEELLRYDSPIQFLYRVTEEPVQVGDTTVEPFQLVTLLLGSANRDPLVFPDPDRLDLRRRPRHYLSFGTGPHACLGSFLARLEGEIALSALATRFPDMTLLDEPLTWHHNPIFRGVEHLPVTL